MYYYIQFTYEKVEIHKDTSLSQSNLTYNPLYPPIPTPAKAEADAKACMQVVYLGRRNIEKKGKYTIQDAL